MHYRALGRTGLNVSAVSFGAWAIGGTWGPVDDEDSLKALHRALDLGVNFFDTADVYGDGHSERLLARLKRERGPIFHVATKVGRRSSPHDPKSYTRENLTAYVERCAKNLQTETLELVQLHCPPTDVYYMPEVFGVLDDLKRAGKLKHYGVSVERVEEALKAIEYPHVQSVQIVFNIFRQRPAELFFGEAQRRKIGILARLPLSSGLLSGKMKKGQHFAPDDHREFNRAGAAFDRGETFSGLDFDTGVDVVEELRALVRPNATLAQFALRWIEMHDAVTCSIPGAKRPEQVTENAAAADLPPISLEVMRRVKEIYDARVRPLVHQAW
ncbi:MAG TPA: aldo/keto reductase [Polyangiaceae bacterium]|jgi:aryl-alcohol dehydrogenase-like predicted oxidoreductase|nr:aldo/keto reductase [Polyangiaceae bacterium]